MLVYLKVAVQEEGVEGEESSTPVGGKCIPAERKALPGSLCGQMVM